MPRHGGGRDSGGGLGGGGGLDADGWAALAEAEAEAESAAPVAAAGGGGAKKRQPFKGLMQRMRPASARRAPRPLAAWPQPVPRPCPAVCPELAARAASEPRPPARQAAGGDGEERERRLGARRVCEGG